MAPYHETGDHDGASLDHTPAERPENDHRKDVPVYILPFPETASVGIVVQRLEDEPVDSWATLADARGLVTVPATAQIGLLYLRRNLAPLATLPPEPIHLLTLSDETSGDDDLAPIQPLVFLRQLYLPEHPCVTDQGLRYLSPLHQLETLEISQTAITDRGLRHLHALPLLRSLELRWTAITGAGFRAM